MVNRSIRRRNKSINRGISKKMRLKGNKRIRRKTSKRLNKRKCLRSKKRGGGKWWAQKKGKKYKIKKPSRITRLANLASSYIPQQFSSTSSASSAAAAPPPPPPDQCHICLVPLFLFEEETTICNHVFHKKCLEEWKWTRESHHNENGFHQPLLPDCPICRGPIGPSQKLQEIERKRVLRAEYGEYAYDRDEEAMYGYYNRDINT
jgi:hypothetical protein